MIEFLRSNHPEAQPATYVSFNSYTEKSTELFPLNITEDTVMKVGRWISLLNIDKINFIPSSSYWISDILNIRLYQGDRMCWVVNFKEIVWLQVPGRDQRTGFLRATESSCLLEETDVIRILERL